MFKNKHTLNLVTIIISIILIFSTISYSNGYQSNIIKDSFDSSRDNTYLSVVPSNQTVDYDENFNIIIHLDPGEPIIGVQIDLYFNSTLIQAVNVSNANPGVWNFFGPPIINNTAGTITGAGVAALGTTVNTPTDCFNITFIAQRANGTSFLNLQNVIVTNQSVQPVVTLIIINGEVTVNAPNNPPNPPSNPSPADGSTSVDINADLSWSCSDPDGNPLTYDIYFGTNSNPPLVQSNQSSTNYDPGTMNSNTVYYWKIVAWDNYSASKSGPIWHFATITGDIEPPKVSIAQPQLGFIYIFFIVQWRLRIYPTDSTLIIGKIDIKANATDNDGIKWVKFYINDTLRETVTEPPYIWSWNELTYYDPYIIKVVASDLSGNIKSDEIQVWKFQLFEVS